MTITTSQSTICQHLPVCLNFTTTYTSSTYLTIIENYLRSAYRTTTIARNYPIRSNQPPDQPSESENQHVRHYPAQRRHQQSQEALDLHARQVL